MEIKQNLEYSGYVYTLGESFGVFSSVSHQNLKAFEVLVSAFILAPTAAKCGPRESGDVGLGAVLRSPAGKQAVCAGEDQHPRTDVRVSASPPGSP